MPLAYNPARSLCKKALLQAFELIVSGISAEHLEAVCTTLKQTECNDPLLTRALRSNYLLNDIWNMILTERERRTGYVEQPRISFEGRW